MKHSLRFPLVNEIKLALPLGTKIAGVDIENDVARLLLEDFPEDAVCEPGGQWARTKPNAEGPAGALAVESHTLQIFLEGETRDTGRRLKGGEMDGARIMEPIPIPEESERLRKLGVLETKETPAIFHVFHVLA